VSVEHPARCEECGSPLAPAQRYCLTCGARSGGRSPELVALLRRVHQRLGVDESLTSPAAPQPANRTLARSAGLRVPSARISALLVLVFLGFGVLLGDVAGSPVQDTLAASARPSLRVVLPASGSPASSASSPEQSASVSSPASSEPPASEPEATPAPAATPTTKAAAPKRTASEANPGAGEGSGGGKAGSGGKVAPAAPATKLPTIKHVFVIMLSDEPYAAVFGPESAARYLSQTLESKGELLTRYDAVAHEELANEVGLLSGQGPTAETAANCPTYSQITPTSIDPDEQVLGDGCVYPASTQTLPGQLSAKQLTARAYVQGIDEAGSAAGACAHPLLGQADPSAVQSASSGPYATFRNPFVYFGSLLATGCSEDDVGLSALKGDLASAKRTPSFSYIVPDRCHDGNPTPCTPGAPAGLAPANAFLQEVVPEILAAKAYNESGLLVITVDEAPSSGAFADSSSCCGQPQFPNLPASSGALSPRGGGTVGALLLSPFVKGATTSQEPFNHFSLLRTIEDLFGLKHLGYAALPQVKSFEPSMFLAGPKG
jgi:phosphatidylinositol-3-phosphatase